MTNGPAARRRFGTTMLLLGGFGIFAAACGSGASKVDAEVSAVTPTSTAAQRTTSQQTTASDTDAGSQQESSGDNPPVASDTVAPTTAPEIDVSNYPQFTSVTSDGVAFNSLDYAGQDLLLWFWAPW